MATDKDVDIFFTFMQKGDMTSYLSYAMLKNPIADEKGEINNAVIVRYDPINGMFVKTYYSQKDMLTDYKDAVNLSQDRGWKISWKGVPCYG